MHPLRNAALLGGLALLGLPVANAAELIISEYVEGSGNNKALGSTTAATRSSTSPPTASSSISTAPARRAAAST